MLDCSVEIVNNENLCLQHLFAYLTRMGTLYNVHCIFLRVICFPHIEINILFINVFILDFQ